MTLTPLQVRKDFQRVINDIGTKISITNKTYSTDNTEYDDNITLTGSSIIWVSGVIQPIAISKSESAESSYVKSLLEQGKITNNDRILYIASGTNILDLSGKEITIGIGSPTILSYKLLPYGSRSLEMGGQIIYQKAFIRVDNNG